MIGSVTSLATALTDTTRYELSGKFGQVPSFPVSWTVSRSRLIALSLLRNVSFDLTGLETVISEVMYGVLRS